MRQMDRYLVSNKLSSYSHSNSTGPFLELKSESVKPLSADLIDTCVFNSFDQQLNESSSNTSSHKSSTSLSNSNSRMSPSSQNDYSNTSNGINLNSSLNSEKSNCKSNSKVKHIIEPNFSLDECISNDFPKIILNKHEHLALFHQDDDDNRTDDDITANYQLSNFIIKLEQIPDIWMIKPPNQQLIKDNDDNKKFSRIINKQTRTSSILHRLIASTPKSNGTHLSMNDQSNRSDRSEHQTNKSPQYRPRYSHVNSTESNSLLPDSTKSISGNNSNNSSKMSRQLSRSPVLTRRPQKIIDIDFDPTLQPIALLSLDTNGSLLSNTNAHLSSCSSINGNKRSLESSTSEEILIKRRFQKSLPIIIIQKHYCISYPINIQRCVDCQTINSSSASIHSTGCRFQYCRTLKYFGDDKYEIDGFTTINKIETKDNEYLITPDSGGQPPLNRQNATYIFTQIAKYFCLMFSHEQNERSVQNGKQIISKRYMAGWREVCDECSTTLFNYHYMCKKCGYMICIECSNEFFQMNNDRRKRKKGVCSHENFYCLAEFIPWNILIKLCNQSIDYFSKLNLNYSIKLYPSSPNENLSTFIKTLKMKRAYDKRDIQTIWSTLDCNFDPNIEFYCHGRLPVFNEWKSETAKNFFQKVWSASCPVLVKHIHKNLSKTLWHPNAFKVHMIDHHDTPALWDCETLTPVQTNETILTQFWDGFERLNVRLKDNGRTRILKLKDWPTKKDFASVFPTRLHDLMTNIPFGDYTRRSYSYDGISYHGGVYNIVERLPACLVKPDLGPKLYIAYSQLTNQSAKKAGTTNLHIDVSDAVNVLVYVGTAGFDDNGLDKQEEIRQVEEEILQSNIDQAQLQRLRNGERPGALWHLFRSDDVKKIRQYISRTQRKTAGSDSIHDQTAYLEKEDLEKLKEWNNVESYPILQFLGDAVFIPSGAPHQVKNLHSCIKIAEDFVSPENLDRCLITANEFRSLSKTHTNHADILQAKNILYYATRDVLNSLTK